MLDTILNIDPVAFSLGPIEIRWYGLAYLAGMLLGLFYAKWIVRKFYISNTQNITTQNIDEIFFWIVLGIIFGARIGYVVFYDPSLILVNPLNVVAIWKGGMSFHGGALGVILAIFFYARLNKISIFSLGDIVCSVVPIGLFFGRIANFINSELWGTITSKPWGVVFSNAGPLPRHPSQLYEAFFEGILLLVILNTLLRKGFLNNSGFISGVFLSLYALFRIIIERFREPDAHIGYIFEYFTIGTLLSIPMLSGIIIVYFSLRKK